VRQLEDIVCQSLVKKSNVGSLALRDLPREIWLQLAGQTRDACDAEAAGPALEVAAPLVFETDYWQLHRFLDSCERTLLEKALRKTCGNQSKTARLLGITPRSVYNKIRKHHLGLKATYL
jgi:DNA-binding NtrC family response regulator